MSYRLFLVLLSSVPIAISDGDLPYSEISISTEETLRLTKIPLKEDTTAEINGIPLPLPLEFAKTDELSKITEETFSFSKDPIEDAAVTAERKMPTEVPIISSDLSKELTGSAELSRTPEETKVLSTDPSEDSLILTKSITEEYAELIHSSNHVKLEETKMAVISYGCPVNPTLPCIPKCCKLNESKSMYKENGNGSGCVDNLRNEDFWVPIEDCPNYIGNSSTSLEERYDYYIGNPCTAGMFVLEPDQPDDKYSIYMNGTMLFSKRLWTMYDYCVDTVKGEIRVFVCFESTGQLSSEFFHILYPIGQIISIPFLLATAAIYAFYEQFRDLRGKSLVCQVLSLAVGFFFLAFVQVGTNTMNQAFCTAAAFIIQFSFMACFFWLNVLSYDTYRNTVDAFRRNHQGGASDKRMFIIYSLYAWNGPFILFIVSLVIDMVPGMPESILKPDFGTTACWFSSPSSALPYFFGPLGFILGINVVFFSLSAYEIIKEKRKNIQQNLEKFEDPDLKKIKKSHRKLRHILKGVKECFLLFLIMGMSWLFEVISWAIGGSSYVWITTDVINTLQGILIFIVFVYQPVPVRNTVKATVSRWWGIITCDRSSKDTSETRHVPLPTVTYTSDDKPIMDRQEREPMVTFDPEESQNKNAPESN